MKKRLLLTLLPLTFLVAACGGNAPAEASSSRATGLSTSAAKSSESSAEQTTSQATDSSTSQAGESTSTEPASSSTEPATGYEIECYVKKGTEVVTWWNDAEAVTYAYVWNGTGEGATDQQFLEAEFVEAYDEGKTLYFSVEVAALPEHILLIRCNPAVVTTLPTAWPEEGVWNQTNDGDVTQKAEEEQLIDAWYADLTIKS